jgi:hypothetical protein
MWNISVRRDQNKNLHRHSTKNGDGRDVGTPAGKNESYARKKERPKGRPTKIKYWPEWRTSY